MTTTVGDSEASELAALFDSLRSSDPQTRADTYTRFAKGHPNGRFSQALLDQAKALRDSALTKTDAAPPVEDAVLSFTAPAHAYAARPLHIGVELRRGNRGAILYVTSGDRTTFESFPMASEGVDYFGAVIPANRIHDSLRIFVEAVDASGVAHPSEGAHTVEITEHADVTLAPAVLAQAGIWSDFATYNTRSLNDWTSQTEGYFGARFRDIGLRAVRSGFGVYRGKGGSLHELDDLGLRGRDVGLTYGYIEAEFGITHIFSMIARGVVGLDEDGIEGGAQAMMRFGNDLGTNLLIGAEILGGVGVRGVAQLEWNAGPRVPIMFRSEVTNQPAGSAHDEQSGVSTSQGDVGVRLIAQVGYRIASALTVSLRGSYQGRTINHAGPGGGAAVAYQW